MFFKGNSKIYRIFGSLPPSHKEFLKISTILILILAFFFIRPILFNLVPSPADLLSYWPMFHVNGLTIQNFNCADVIDQYEPWYIFNYQSFKDLQIPLWNPYGAGGVPHLANMQSSLFLFLTWPFYILGFTGFSLLIFYFAKFFLTGIFSYYYLRSIKLRFYPSLLGAIGFMFVGFNIVWMQWPASNAMFLVPAFLYIVEKIAEKGPQIKYFIGISVLSALGLLSGHPETFVYIPPLTFLYLLFRLWTNGSKISVAFNAVIKFFAFSALGMALSAIQILPTIEYLLNSYGWIVRNNGFASSIDWHALILNFMPDYYGTATSMYIKIPYYVDFVLYQSSAGYVGISLLCLAAFAVLTKLKDRLVQFYLLLGLWTVGVIYHVPLIFDITRLIPIISQSNNSRTLFLLGFTVVVLGSIGLDRIMDNWENVPDKSLIKKFSLSCLAVLLLFLLLAYANSQFLVPHLIYDDPWIKPVQIGLVLLTCALIFATLAIVYLMVRYAGVPRLRNLAIIGLLLLVFLETGGHAMLYLPYINQEYFHQGDDPFAPIVDQGGLYRATSIDPVNHLSVYPVNTQMIYGVYDIRNYDAIEVKYSRQLFNNCTTGKVIGLIDIYNANKNYLDFMGVKWVYSGADLSRALGVNVSEKTRTLGALNNNSTIIQEFTSPKANLSGIELRYSLNGNPGGRSNVTQQLIDKDADTVVRNVTIDSSDLEDDQWYLASFAPLNDSANTTYMLIVSDDDSRDSGISLWMDDDDDLPGSALSIDGKHSDGSLSMRTYHDDDSEDTDYKLVEKTSNYYLLDNDGALPRAFMAYNATFTRNDSLMIDELSDPSTNWVSPLLIYGEDRNVSYPGGDSNVTVLDYQPMDIRILANTTSPGFLVLTDTYYPGWNAYVNGKKVDILRTDYAFRSVPLDAGTNIVEFKYEPMSFYVGALISAISLLILLSLILFTIVRNKKIRPKSV